MEVQTSASVSDPRSGVPHGPVLFLMGFLVVLIISIGVWIFLMRDQLNTRKAKDTQSVHCPAFQCPTGTQAISVQLDPTKNPNTSTYETFNYCSINAPPTSFVQSLELCGGIVTSSQVNAGGSTISPANAKQVTDFAKFYDEDYVDTCGFSWKNPPSEDPNQKTPQADPVIIALLACAEKLSVDNNTNVQSLKTKCPACDPTNVFVLLVPS